MHRIQYLKHFFIYEKFYTYNDGMLKETLTIKLFQRIPILTSTNKVKFFDQRV